MPTQGDPQGSLCSLLDQLHIISNETLEELSDKKNDLTASLLNHRLHGSLYEILMDVKEKTGIKQEIVEEKYDGDLFKLNRLLVVEGVMSGPDGSIVDNNPAGCDQTEFKEELQQIRTTLHNNMEKKNRDMTAFFRDLVAVMRMQQKLRPITEKEIDRMVTNIRKYAFDDIEIKIKQKVCEEFMRMKQKLLDARRKRKNFSKSSTSILNQYFEANLDHPYPSEDVKVELARKCNISVAQVSNWFGNKRIRYKKKRTSQMEQAVGAAQQSAQAMANHNASMPNIPSSLPSANPMMFGYPGMFNAYQGMFPNGPPMNMVQPTNGGPGGFDLGAYQPQMMMNTYNIPSTQDS